MMNEDCIRILSTAQLRLLEATWIKACHPEWALVLMEQAGAAAAAVARTVCQSSGMSAVIFCGRGNNGGDGFVVARHLHRLGIPVCVVLADTGSKPKEGAGKSAAEVNRSICDLLGIEIHEVGTANLDIAREAILTADLVVDALLGTGIDRAVEGIYASLIELINGSGLPVISIDLPSGIHSDTGAVMGVAVQADATVTFAYLKGGLLHHPGATYAGVINVVDIGLPDTEDLPESMSGVEKALASEKWWLMTAAQTAGLLPERPDDSNKGTFGRLLCVAGSLGMTGSAILAARTALRCGTGITVLATATSIVNTLPAEELIYCRLPETGKVTIAKDALAEIKLQLDSATAVLLGPGLTTLAETQQLAQELVSLIDKPCIVDADGLNAIAAAKSGIKFGAPEKFVLTPHPKELSRLLNITVAKVQEDRVSAALAAVRKFGCNVILKGSHTVVATCDEQIYVIPTGNSGMATAGAGDVLSGVVGALLAQNVPANEAAVAAAYLHAAAGDLAADTIGEDGLIASNIMHALPEVLRQLREGTFEGSYLEQEAKW